ncbi:MAG: hypothetical protein V4526_00425 [Patescibacteria group bacterium]
MTKVIADCTNKMLVYRERICFFLIALLVLLVGYYAILIQNTVFNIAEREKIVKANHTYVSDIHDMQSELFKLRSTLDLSLASSRGLAEPAQTIYITKKSLGHAAGALAHEL